MTELPNLEERLRKQREVLDNLPEVTVRPCSECPWLRTARPGHLGPMTAQEWIETIHGESPIACHETIKHNDQDWTELRQCAGAAIFRANVFKTPRHPKVARAKEPDTEKVFGWNDEFINHHEGDPVSYVRFAWGPNNEYPGTREAQAAGPSDLYLIGTEHTVDDMRTPGIECCGCILDGGFPFFTKILDGGFPFFTKLDDIIGHLDAHRKAGHTVHAYVQPAVEEDFDANGDYIARWLEAKP